MVIWNLIIACPQNEFIPWYRRLGVPKNVIAVILFIVGLFFLLWGKEYIKPCSFVIVSLCFGMIVKSLIMPVYELEIKCKVVYNLKLH